MGRAADLRLVVVDEGDDAAVIVLRVADLLDDGTCCIAGAHQEHPGVFPVGAQARQASVLGAGQRKVAGIAIFADVAVEKADAADEDDVQERADDVEGPGHGLLGHGHVGEEAHVAHNAGHEDL